MEGLHDASALVQASTRLTPPRLRDELVARTGLVDRILESEEPVVAVSAPAGSGKSTLLAQAYHRCSRAVWVSIDVSDGDPAVLWSALIDSTARLIPGFGGDYRSWLDVAGSQAVDAIIPRFVNDLVETSGSVHFFLDDLQFLPNGRSLDSLSRLIDQVPPEVGFIIASRTAMPFPLGRLRMDRAVVEIGSADLAMNVDEARAASSAAGVDLDDAQLLKLVARTEGWVAGLAWATMAIQATSDTTSVVDTVGSVDGELATYLVEEVLEQRSPELREFMLETSILTQFNASLCDQMRGRTDSRLLIEELDRTNSFIVPLDRHGEWFRYHHLVHDVLKTRLERESPGVVRDLHLRAASWLRDHDGIAESIRHARAGGDNVAAADTLCSNWWGMMNRGRLDTVHSLFEDIDDAEICSYQPLAIAATFLYSLAGDDQLAQVYFGAAESGHFEGPPPDGSASIESAIAILRGSVSLDGVDATLAAGLTACDLEPIGSKWRPLATLITAMGHVWRGELDAAEPLLEEALSSGRSSGTIVVYGLGELALIRVAFDDVERAVSVAEEGCELAERMGLEAMFVTALARGAAATARLAAGDERRAAQHLDAARVPMAEVGSAMPIDAMRTRLVLADVATQLGRLTEARGHLDAASYIDSRYEDTGVLTTQIEIIRKRLTEAAEAAPVHLSDREQAVLELMTTELSVREIAEALYVSKETVKTHRRHIYQKLNATSRADAVIAARRAGLFPDRGRDPAPIRPA